MTLGITFACIGVLSAMTPMSPCMWPYDHDPLKVWQISSSHERSAHVIIAWMYLSFIQNKTLKIVCIPKLTYLDWYNIGISFEGPGLVWIKSFELKLPQTLTRSGFYVGWMKRTFLCDNSVSQEIVTSNRTLLLCSVGFASYHDSEKNLCRNRYP